MSSAPERSTDSQKAWVKPLALTGIIAGSALIVLGGGMGIRAIRKNNEAKDESCSKSECTTQEGLDLTDDARTAATISTVGWAVGGTFLAAGLLTYVLAPDEDTRVSLSVDSQRAALSFGGSF